MTRLCRQCETALRPQSRYCLACGAPVRRHPLPGVDWLDKYVAPAFIVVIIAQLLLLMAVLYWPL